MDEWDVIEVSDKDRFGWVDFILKKRDTNTFLDFHKNIDYPAMGEVLSLYRENDKPIVLNMDVDADLLERIGIDIPALRAMATMMR